MCVCVCVSVMEVWRGISRELKKNKEIQPCAFPLPRLVIACGVLELQVPRFLLTGLLITHGKQPRSIVYHLSPRPGSKFDS